MTYLCSRLDFQVVLGPKKVRAVWTQHKSLVEMNCQSTQITHFHNMKYCHFYFDLQDDGHMSVLSYRYIDI